MTREDFPRYITGWDHLIEVMNHNDLECDFKDLIQCEYVSSVQDVIHQWVDDCVDADWESLGRRIASIPNALYLRNDGDGLREVTPEDFIEFIYRLYDSLSALGEDFSIWTKLECSLCRYAQRRYCEVFIYQRPCNNER